MDDATRKTVETLNDLIETCKDGEYGFNACAENGKSPELKRVLMGRANECRSAAQQLQTQVSELGGEAEESGSFSGSVHRGWVAVKNTLSTYDDLAVLEECERGEDVAIKSYQQALKQPLPDHIRALVQLQYEGVKRNHDEVRRLRDAAKVSS